MPAYIKTLKDGNNDIIYPQSLTKAIYNDAGAKLDNILNTKADETNASFTGNNPTLNGTDVLMANKQISNPNLLINGNFQVWQRGTEFINITSSAYSTDRWSLTYLQAMGVANVNIKKVANGVSISSLNNSHPWINFTQKTDLFNLLGKTCTLTTKISSLETEPMNDTKYVGLYAQVIGYTTPVIGLVYANKTGVITTTFTFPTDVADVTKVEFGINFVGGINVSNITVEYIKLELGSIATQFVPKSYGEELAACQRYYQADTKPIYQTLGTAIVQDTITNEIECIASLPVTTRTIYPTIKLMGVNLMKGNYEIVKIKDNSARNSYSSFGTIRFIAELDTAHPSSGGLFFIKNNGEQNFIFSIDDEIY